MDYAQSRRDSWELMLLRAAEKISLSEPQYEVIDGRYQQLESILQAARDPFLQNAHIFVQGSMRLRTTIKPVADAPKDLDTIDADAIVWLPNAAGADARTVLSVIKDRFSEGSRVEAEIVELRRGVRIVYADENPGFHIDVTPARSISGNLLDRGGGKLEVPDREMGWKASSPIPYCDWLDSASKLTLSFEDAHIFDRALAEASMEPLPAYHQYSEHDPLRALIKLLKRHRDEWAIRSDFPEYRPISAVITTLATKSYLEVVAASQHRSLQPLEAMLMILSGMPAYVTGSPGSYGVHNPKDLGENFAEKWNRPDGSKYRDAFLRWHSEAYVAMHLGLKEHSSNESFNRDFQREFGVGPSFVTEVNREIPHTWNLAGRPLKTTKNEIALGALSGHHASGSEPQSQTKPVGRLGYDR